MMNFMPKGEQASRLVQGRRRGRPERPEGERFRTIAWFRYIEDQVSSKSSSDLIRMWSACGIEVDTRTLDRYRTGEITPTEQRRRHLDQFVPGSYAVFEVGPGRVPLWDSLWAATTPEDWRLAEALLPSGRWPVSSLAEVFCEDGLLGRILEFCESIQHQTRLGQLPILFRNALDPDLIALSLAIRVFRVNAELDRASTDLHGLLRGCLALPGASDALSTFGVLEAMSGWVNDRCAINCSSAHHVASWMSDRAHFLRLVEQTAANRRSVREALWSGLFSIPSA